MRIGVLTSRFLGQYMEQVLEPFADQVQIELFYYENSAQTAQIFASIQDRFDGFLVNGVLTHGIIRRVFPDLEKPVEYFNVDMVSYCEQLIKMLLENRSLDLQRVFVDISVFFEEQKLEQVLMEDGIEEMGIRYVNKIDSMTLDELLTVRQDLEEKLKRTWQNGEIDCVLTRFTTLVPALKQLQIPYYFAYPSKEYVRDAFRKLMSDIRVNQMKNSLPAVIAIRLRRSEKRSLEETLEKECGGQENDAEFSELEQLVLQKALLEYGREMQEDFLIKKHYRSLEAVTNAESVGKLTEGRTVCSLKAYLEKELHRPLCIGYGIGQDMASARINALNACQESASTAGGSSYLMDQEERLYGPLDGCGKRILLANPEEWMQTAAKAAGLSVLTLQRIQAVLDGMESTEVTARLLAEKLGIGIRAASRYLVRLSETGGAECSGQRQGKTKGRPEQVYRVDLRKIES